MTTSILMFLWWFSGVACFVYWWVKDFDLTIPTLLVGAWVGLIGPIAFIVGYSLHTPHAPHTPSKVLIKRRK